MESSLGVLQALEQAVPKAAGPSPSVVIPALLKHNYWSETSASAIPALLKRGAIGQLRPSWALGTYWVICCGSLDSLRDQDFS